jgi:hypothetical protein
MVLGASLNELFRSEYADRRNNGPGAENLDKIFGKLLQFTPLLSQKG